MASVNAQSQIRSRDKDQAVLMLITIYDGTPVRLVNNLVDITSRGNVYTAMPLQVDTSPDDGETLQTVDLKIDNVSLEMIDWARTLVAPIQVSIELIFSGDTETVEQSISDLVIRSVQYDSMSIMAQLMADDDLNQLIPSDIYDAIGFPGLF